MLYNQFRALDFFGWIIRSCMQVTVASATFLGFGTVEMSLRCGLDPVRLVGATCVGSPERYWICCCDIRK